MDNTKLKKVELLEDDTGLISVIVPIYNVEKYLRRCIDSIINQTYKNLEIILIDDGSTDDTYRIVQEYSTRDERIKALKRDVPEKGSLVCRNIGQRLVKGKYFIHFDSDDIIEPFCLQQRVDFM